RPGLGVRFDRLPDGEDSLCAFLFGSLREEQQEASVAAGAAQLPELSTRSALG
ncbi:MAG: hypothetical protein JWN48_1339, partial [Myxococcaceae bacterium]|nr:hypothetical protein [Myxococcaceae bacterium]